MPPLKRVSGSPMTADQLDTYLLAHEYQVGALYFGDGSIQLDYNTSVVNFLPIALNLVNNALLQHTRALHGFADNANPVSVRYVVLVLFLLSWARGSGVVVPVMLMILPECRRY